MKMFDIEPLNKHDPEIRVAFSPQTSDNILFVVRLHYSTTSYIACYIEGKLFRINKGPQKTIIHDSQQARKNELDFIRTMEKPSKVDEKMYSFDKVLKNLGF